jgi:hypothetical protein
MLHRAQSIVLLRCIMCCCCTIVQFDDVKYLEAKNAVDADAMSEVVWQQLVDQVSYVNAPIAGMYTQVRITTCMNRFIVYTSTHSLDAKLFNGNQVLLLTCFADHLHTTITPVVYWMQVADIELTDSNDSSSTKVLRVLDLGAGLLSMLLKIEKLQGKFDTIEYVAFESAVTLRETCLHRLTTTMGYAVQDTATDASTVTTLIKPASNGKVIDTFTLLQLHAVCFLCELVHGL